MLVIKFVIHGTKITWFINNNWIMLLSFLLTIIMSIGFKRIKNS